MAKGRHQAAQSLQTRSGNRFMGSARHSSITFAVIWSLRRSYSFNRPMWVGVHGYCPAIHNSRPPSSDKCNLPLSRRQYRPPRPRSPGFPRKAAALRRIARPTPGRRFPTCGYIPSPLAPAPHPHRYLIPGQGSYRRRAAVSLPSPQPMYTIRPPLTLAASRISLAFWS